MQYLIQTVHRCMLGLLFVLLLSACHSVDQRSKSAQIGASFKKDSALIMKYASICQERLVSHDSCLKILQAGYNLAKKHGLQPRMIYMLGLKASIMADQGNFDASKLYIDSAFRLNETVKDRDMIFFLNNVAATTYQNSGDYAKSATHYFRALEVVEGNDRFDGDRPFILPSLYHNLGALMFSLNEDSLARKYILMAQYYALQRKPVDSALIAGLQFSIGETYMNYDSAAALNYCRNAYRMAKKFNASFIMYNILITLTKCYMAQGQYDSADYYLRLAKESNNTKVLETETASAALALLKKDDPAAMIYLQSALNLANEEDHQWRGEIYEAFSRLYAGRKQYQKAYEFHKKYMEQYQKRMDDPKKTVADFMVNLQSLENEKKMMQKQAQLLAKDTAIKRRNLWIGAMCLLSALLCIILAMAYRNYRNKRVLLNERMKTLQQNQEIEQLKAEAQGADKERTRIAYDLHDGVMIRLANIKMNLNAVTATLPGFTDNNHYPDMMGQLELATLELRNTAHNLMPEILLEDGVEQAIFYFCKATGQASGITIKFQQMGDPLPRLQANAEISVYRIVQELVQNIIRHAQATTALVQLQYRDGLCAITVEDNGRGITASKTQEGYGLKSIRNRIKVLHGTFDIESNEEHGATAYVEFDVRPFLAGEPQPQQASGQPSDK